MVDHLRWDLKQILDLAVAEGVISKNPVYVPPGTMLLFVPRECRQPSRPVMTLEEAKTAFNALDLRERVVVKLAVIAGMRCSEIFGLRRGRVKDGLRGNCRKGVSPRYRYAKDGKVHSRGRPVRRITTRPEALAQFIARHRAGWMAVSVRATIYANRSRQSHEEKYQATHEDGRAGLG